MILETVEKMSPICNEIERLVLTRSLCKQGGGRELVNSSCNNNIILILLQLLCSLVKSAIL